MSNYFVNSRLCSDQLKALIPLFSKELKADFLEAGVYFNNSHDEGCCALLHKIKGNALSFGVKELAESIQNVHSEIKAKEYLKAKDNMTKIKLLVNTLIEESKKYEA